MAKRELIDKVLFMNDLKESLYVSSSDICKFSWIMEKRKPITEEQIVKPYLEKLKEEIQKEENILYHDCEADFSKSYAVIRTDTVIELIDNLLTEKGVNE